MYVPTAARPYHRACYEKQGACVYAGKHGAGFEWTPPRLGPARAPLPQLRRLQPGGRRPPAATAVLPLRPARRHRPRVDANRQAQQSAGGFNYAPPVPGGPGRRLLAVQRCQRRRAHRRHLRRGLGRLSGPRQPLLPAGLCTDAEVRPQKAPSAFRLCCSGPLYFFYRKAWKPAFAFLAVDLLLNLPALLELLVLRRKRFRPCHQLLVPALSGPAGLHRQLCCHGPERDVRQVPLPPQRRRTHPPDRGRIPRKGPAGRQSSGPRAGSAGPPSSASAL